MRRVKFPAQPKVENIRIAVDNREQGDVPPWDMAPMPWEWATLATGDFGLLDLPGVACVERKTLPDLVQCVARGRSRFDRELVRMRAFPYRIVIVECNYSALQIQSWHGKVTPAAVIGSVCAWMGQTGFLFAGDAETAADACKRFLYTAAKREWRKLRKLAGGILETEAAKTVEA